MFLGEISIFFEGLIDLAQMKRTLGELWSWLFRKIISPNGCFLRRGTGIVPSKEFTLNHGDEVSITIEPTGSLVNSIE